MNIILRDIYFNKICSSILISSKIRRCLLKMGEVIIGKGVTVLPGCFVGNSDLLIGNGTFINYNVWFNTAGGIKIGQNCNIAYKVTFITSTHEISNNERRAGNPISQGIEVGDGTWIGAGATIMPGVKIGKGVIVAAGSVVTKNCEENCLYSGVPAKKIKSLKYGTMIKDL